MIFVTVFIYFEYYTLASWGDDDVKRIKECYFQRYLARLSTRYFPRVLKVGGSSFVFRWDEGPIFLKGSPNAVTVVGGEYFFMPSKSALTYLAQAI